MNEGSEVHGKTFALFVSSRSIFGGGVVVLDLDPAISPANSPTAISSGEPENQMEILALRLAQGDDGVFWTLFEIFGPRLAGLFKRKGVADTDAENLALDCLLTVRRQIGKYQRQEGGSFTGWVFTIAYRKWIDWRRRNLTTLPLDDDLLNRSKCDGTRSLEPFIEPEVDHESPDERSQAVHDALKQLSKDYQEVIRLRYIEACLDNAEIAARLGITVNNAKIRLHRAHKRLSPILENDNRIKLRK
jgi:RNA polymerase sigma-70 factor (ECF subfamily)